VRAANDSGVWSEQDAVTSLTFLPHFYETWWFRVLSGLFFAALLYAAYQGRTRSIRSRNRELEELVQERDRAAAELRSSEERFRVTYEKAPLGIAVVDRDGVFRDVNCQICEFMGYSRDELIGTNFRDISYSEDLPASEKLLERLFAGKEQETLDTRYVRKDGSVVWGRVMVTQTRDPEGTPILIAAIEDIHERKMLREKLEESEEHLKAFMEHNPASIYMKDETGKHTYANPTMLKAVGISLDQFVDNLIERAVILSPGPVLQIDESLGVGTLRLEPDRLDETSVLPSPGETSSSRSLEEIERSNILGVLEECAWKVAGDSGAAQKLGLKESTLRKRMQKLGIRRPTRNRTN
jgi:PAS domain S-box-containing protein